MAERCIYADDFLDLFYVASAGQDKMFVKVVEQVVEDTPTADVAEVKHGKWIYHECVLSYDGTISGHSCSVCGAFVHEETFDNDTFYNKYCGNCGARMDGEK